MSVLDKKIFKSVSNKERLPVVFLKNMVVFPNNIYPLFITREKDFNAVNASTTNRNNKQKDLVLVITQKDKEVDYPENDEVYHVGTLCKISNVTALGPVNLKLHIDVVCRIEINKFDFEDEITYGSYSIMDDVTEHDTTLINKAADELIILFKQCIEHYPYSGIVLDNIKANKNRPDKICSILADHLNNTSIEGLQEILEEKSLLTRLNKVTSSFSNELIKATIDDSLRKRIKKQLEKTQKQYLLKETIQAAQNELDSDGSGEFDEFEKKLKNLSLSKEAHDRVSAELKKLKITNNMSPEYSILHSYIDTILSLPWGKISDKKVDIDNAEEILNKNHYGIQDVKNRILEQLSVVHYENQKNITTNKSMKGSILCLIGPPGIGKTSLVKSIADAMGKSYVKISLNGVKDESQIRGHRKTYIGAMPGKIISSLKTIGFDDSVVLLDEIDKLSSDHRGDPADALLEVLDPEQNESFVDNFLDIKYDLSKVIFIATANSYNFPLPLRDRLEIINLSSYLDSEKFHIAKEHLIKKVFDLYSVNQGEITISDDAIREIIQFYTREAGVRELQRLIATLSRKSIKKMLKSKASNIFIDRSNIVEYLGEKKYTNKVADESNQVGVTNGLAYNGVGGDLCIIEAISYPGKGLINSTGKLGEVMKESAQIAYSCFKAFITENNLTSEDYKDFNVHLHVPEGATPKDGPSAGVAMYITILSLFTNIPVYRDVAMTGELSLSGRVLPIGGLKEKLFAAVRGGIKKVLIPKDNKKDLEDVPNEIKEQLNIILITHVREAVKEALDLDCKEEELNRKISASEKSSHIANTISNI